jgi:hypothetical protein
MRDETGKWLEPMLEAVEDRPDIDVRALIARSTMPAAKADSPHLDKLARLTQDAPAVKTQGFDWVRFGELLRHELGWDETYPAYPDFPETRDTP